MLLPRLFISYRRDDTEAYAGRIFDHLERKLDPGEIFIDVDAIEIGQDFEESVRAAISTAYAVLVLIGSDWLTASDLQGGRRIDRTDDPVRLEIETALSANCLIIPVLCGTAAMPLATDLPPAISRLSYLNAVRITSSRFRQDMTDLEEAIDAARYRQQAGAEIRANSLPGPRLVERENPDMVAGGTRRAGLSTRVSEASLGAYRYDDVAQYEGLFEMIRPDFMEKEQVHCYAMSIGWDVDLRALVIRHKGIEGSVYRQFGVISFAQNEKYLSIDAGSQGWRQLAILERMNFRRVMYGAMFTLGNVERKVFAPTLSPMVLIGYSGPERSTRRIRASDPDYQVLEQHLQEARNNCVRLA